MRKQKLPLAGAGAGAVAAAVGAAAIAVAIAVATHAAGAAAIAAVTVAGVAGTASTAVAAIAFGEAGIFGVSKKKGTNEVFSPPGATAVRALQFLLPKKAYDGVFAQVVADTRDEYFAALAEGNKAKARWIRVRDSINLAVVFVQYLIAACLDRGMKIYKTFGSK